MKGGLYNMCVIIAKNKASRLPTKDELKNCYTYNNDGAGFMYTDKNKVVIDKGYMSYEAFIDKFDELCEKYNDFIDKSLVIHCRITTDGSTNPKNCHPFALSDSIGKMQKTQTTAEIGVAHNGIIADYRPDTKSKKTPDISDTILFIKKYLAPIQKQFKEFYKNQAFLDGVELITNSKFAFLDGNDFLTTCGDFINEDGLLFSNYSYIPYTPTYSNYSNYYDYYADYFDDYGNETDEKTSNDYLLQIPDYYFAELIDEETDEIIYKTLQSLKTDDASVFWYNPVKYELIEIDADGYELQKIEYINIFNENFEYIF